MKLILFEIFHELGYRPDKLSIERSFDLADYSPGEEISVENKTVKYFWGSGISIENRIIEKIRSNFYDEREYPVACICPKEDLLPEAFRFIRYILGLTIDPVFEIKKEEQIRKENDFILHVRRMESGRVD